MESLVPSRTELEAALGTEIRGISPLPVASGGYHSTVFEIDCAGVQHVLRIPKGQQGFHTQFVQRFIPSDRWFDQRWATDKARSLTIPAPEIAYSSRGDEFRFGRFVVLKKLDGVQITDYEDWNGCPYDESEFGAMLAKLHSVDPGGFGPVDDFGETYFNTWPTFLQAVADHFLSKCLERGSISPSLHAVLAKKWYPLLQRIDLGSPSLLHMESLGFANILYDATSRKITGLLDYEDCLGGDPLFELTWMHYYFEDNGPGQTYFDFDRFALGYGSLPNDEHRSLVYKPFTWLQKLSWIDTDSTRAAFYPTRIQEICNEL